MNLFDSLIGSQRPSFEGSPFENFLPQGTNVIVLQPNEGELSILGLGTLTSPVRVDKLSEGETKRLGLKGYVYTTVSLKQPEFSERSQSIMSQLSSSSSDAFKRIGNYGGQNELLRSIRMKGGGKLEITGSEPVYLQPVGGE